MCDYSFLDETNNGTVLLDLYQKSGHDKEEL